MSQSNPLPVRPSNLSINIKAADIPAVREVTAALTDAIVALTHIATDFVCPEGSLNDDCKHDSCDLAKKEIEDVFIVLTERTSQYGLHTGYVTVNVE